MEQNALRFYKKTVLWLYLVSTSSKTPSFNEISKKTDKFLDQIRPDLLKLQETNPQEPDENKKVKYVFMGKSYPVGFLLKTNNFNVVKSTNLSNKAC